MGNGIVIATDGHGNEFRSPSFSPSWRYEDGLEHDVRTEAVEALLPEMTPDPTYPEWKQRARERQITRMLRSRERNANARD